MIGQFSKDKKVTIIGGGFAGLLAAYRLSQKDFDVHLIEKKSETGGLIGTTHTDYGLAEAAAHSTFGSPLVRDFFHELNIPLYPLEHKKRFVLRGGKLRQIPVGPIEILSFLFHLTFKGAKPSYDNLADWGAHHLSPYGMRYMLSPFVNGIYAAPPALLAREAIWPSMNIPHGRSLLRHALTEFRKNKKKPAGIMAPAKGMGQITAALSAILKERLGARFETAHEVSKLPSDGQIVITTPSYVAARLVEDDAPETAAALRKIRYLPLVSTTVFLAKKDLGKIPSGVGFLAAPDENFHCLGILFNSSSFAGRVENDDHISLTVMMGGARKEDIIHQTDEVIQKMIAEDLQKLFGLRADPLHFVIHRWEKALPLYNHDLCAAWQKAREDWCAPAGHVLFGNYTGNISLRKMIEVSAAWPDRFDLL